MAGRYFAGSCVDRFLWGFQLHSVACQSEIHRGLRPQTGTTVNPQPTVRVYSKPNCMQCRLTEKWLTDHAVPFIHDSAEADGVADAARSLGVTAAPIVVVGDEVWGGFRPDLLEQYCRSDPAEGAHGRGDFPARVRRSR